MRHKSVPISAPCEFVDMAPLNPLISKCVIKVCYVSDEPNRNRSVITKETGRKMAPSLRGAPIVGYYSEKEEDFEQHNRSIEIDDEGFKVIEKTRPYGFVSETAKIWFQKFIDDDQVEREYLCTEGYLWTGQYPEAQRVIDKGNNQSMELDEKSLNAHWTKDERGKPKFFIINEGIISKLCILGDDYEPCFEGSQIVGESISNYSFDATDFMNQMKEMVKKVEYLLKNEGGAKMPTEEILEQGVETPAEELTSSEDTEFKKKPDEEEEDKKEKESEDKKDESEGSESDEDNSEEEEEEDKKKKKTYSCEEYDELVSKYEQLENRFNELTADFEALKSANNDLAAFKLATERQSKQAMIDSFYMLSAEDKQDVVSNIDTYSLDDIEAKLSVICVRNKVSFDLNNDKGEPAPVVYNLNSQSNEDISTPDWVKAVVQTSKSM